MGAYSLGLCKWDLPTLILVIAVAVIIAAHNYRHKKKVEEFKAEIEEKKEGKAADGWINV